MLALVDKLKFESEFFDMRQHCKGEGTWMPLLQVTSMMQLVVAGTVGPALSVLSHHTKNKEVLAATCCMYILDCIT